MKYENKTNPNGKISLDNRVGGFGNISSGAAVAC
jgi:hypothetical protein